MRRFRFRIMAGVLTFAVGVAGVWLVGLVPVAGIPLLARIAPRLVFRPTWRACGNGYAQAYRLPDGQKVAEGSVGFETAEVAREKYRSEIGKATRIIERAPEFKNRHGDEGERVVLLVSDEAAQQHARILWYGGGRYYFWLAAPSLEIARAFEQSNAYAY